MARNRNETFDRERRKLTLGLTMSAGSALLIRSAAAASGHQPSARTGDFLWTPRRDQNGNIVDSSWAELPANAWVEVADTNPIPIIARKIVAAGFPFSPPFGSMSLLESHVRGSFKAWVSGALDAEGGRFYVPWGGGHGDGALNGVWRLDLFRMEWNIQKMPSHPKAPGFEWTEKYIQSRSWTQYRDNAGEYWDVAKTGSHDALPDGRPTSRHQYEGVVFDAARNCVMQHRLGRWSLDIETNVEKCERYEGAGLVPGEDSTNQRCYFDQKTKDVFAGSIKHYDYWGFYRITPDMRITKLASAPKGYHFSSDIAGRIVGREIIFVGMGSRGKSYEPHWSVYDIDRNRWRTGKLSDWPEGVRTETMQAMEWVPDVGKLLYWNRSGWRFFWITPDRWTIESAVFGGRNPPPAAYTGHKFFYWPARKLLVAALGITDKEPGGVGAIESNIYVMKVA